MKKFYLWLQYKNKRLGSSLIELLIVVTLLVILVSLAIPSLVFLRQQSISSELDKLQIVCHLLQKQAVNYGRKEYLLFNVADHAYFYCNHTEHLTQGCFFNYIKGVSGPPANPKEAISLPVTFPHQKIIFYPNGAISAGTVYLTDKYAKTMYALTVPISQVSFMRKYKYHNGSWTYLK